MWSDVCVDWFSSCYDFVYLQRTPPPTLSQWLGSRTAGSAWRTMFHRVLKNFQQFMLQCSPSKKKYSHGQVSWAVFERRFKEHSNMLTLVIVMADRSTKPRNNTCIINTWRVSGTGNYGTCKGETSPGGFKFASGLQLRQRLNTDAQHACWKQAAAWQVGIQRMSAFMQNYCASCWSM